MTLREALAKRLAKTAVALERPSVERAEELADAYRKGIEAAHDWITANGFVLVNRDALGVYQRVYHDVYCDGSCGCRAN